MTDGKKNLNVVFMLAKSFFKRSKSHFKFSLIAMSIGVWGLIVVSSIINGFSSVLVDSITFFYPHVVVYGYYDQNLPEVSSLIHFKITGTAIFNKNQLFFSQLFETNDISFYKNFLTESSDTSGLIIGKKLSENLEVDIGHKLILITIDKFLPFTQEYIVSGIFNSGVQVYDSNLILHENPNIDPKMLSYTGIFLNNPKKSKQFKQKYLNNYSALTWEESNETLLKAVQLDSLFAFIITFFIILISGFSVSNAVSFSVFTRKRTIGILRALGLNKREISLIFVIESFLISLIGFFIGDILGIITCLFLILLKIPLPQDLFYVNYLPIKILPSTFLIAFVTNTLVSILFSFISSQRAAKINLVEALREE
ncbi:MAG TPA: FtsX-like permease family protein [Defluviitoga sp.]|nr:FtsX-like permease family protein [Defluviitoga sp.]HOP24402.1 FtsX-like permease family protein [Defluviitoga sp.]HPZ28608.1 FtsX-like permease family protein [Defluviitoga sp.]HQD62601.1 FtsX-like permease family protein [Defluviitoga sp.]